MSANRKLHGFVVCIRTTPKIEKNKISGVNQNWWTQLYRLNPLCEILRLSKSAGSKPIAVIKVYLK